MLLFLEGFLWFDQKLQAHLQAHDLALVSRTESMVMLLAGAGWVRPSELAAKLGLARQTINSAMRALEQKGLIVLEEDPDDRRCRIIKAAPDGEQVYAHASTALAAAYDELAEHAGAQVLWAVLTELGPLVGSSRP